MSCKERETKKKSVMKFSDEMNHAGVLCYLEDFALQMQHPAVLR